MGLMRRATATGAGLTMAGVCALVVVVAGASGNGTPPSFVVVLADDLGTFDLGCYGHPTIRTPSIDSMAAGGAILTQWLSAAPICTPSRASFYTGRLPFRNGMYADREHAPHGGGAAPPSATFGVDAWQRKDGAGGLPSSEVTLPELLGGRGYTSMLCGKWHLGQRTEYWSVIQ